MTCETCGTALPDDSRFCSNCGRAVSSHPRDAYRSAHELSRWTIGLLWLTAVTAGAAAIADFAEQRLYQRLIDHRYVSLAEAHASDDRQAVISVLQGGLVLATAVFFILWLRRSYANLDALDGRRRYSVRWAIWCWFVPVMALWRPKQIVNDLLTGDPRPSTRTLVNWWWATFLVSNWVAGSGARLLFEGSDPQQLHNAAIARVVANVIEVPAAILAVLVVRRLTTAQETARVAATITAVT
jgi:predicted nucleic acid-binding Zn ribbon protein